ncbi:phage tail protein [Enterobacter hormaechei]
MADVLAARTSGALYKAQLLDYYYSRRAESAIGNGQRFEIKSACWGKSTLVSVNEAGGWNISDIPTDFALEDMTNNFAKCELVRSVQGNIITLNAVLPQDSLEQDTVYDFNTLVLLDAEDKAIAVLATQQDTVYLGKNYSIIMMIEQAGS